MKPLAKYNLEQNESEITDFTKNVWCAILDKRYKCEVQYLEDNRYKGTLAVFDGFDNDKLIYQKNVVVSFGGPFGPDMVDVQEWQEMVCNIVDNLSAT